MLFIWSFGKQFLEEPNWTSIPTSWIGFLGNSSFLFHQSSLACLCESFNPFKIFCYTCQCILRKLQRFSLYLVMLLCCPLCSKMLAQIIKHCVVQAHWISIYPSSTGALPLPQLIGLLCSFTSLCLVPEVQRPSHLALSCFPKLLVLRYAVPAATAMTASAQSS